MLPRYQIARLGFTRFDAGCGWGYMVNENRAHAYDGMDRAGHATSTPQGPCDGGSLTIGELARDAGVTLRALRFYQSKGLLTPRRNGSARLFSHDDRQRLALILQGKRLGFTLTKIREMLAARARGLHQGSADRSAQVRRADQSAGAPAARHRGSAGRIAANLHGDVCYL